MPTPNMTKGLVQMPGHNVQLVTQKVEGVGMNRLGPRVRKGLGWHRALGGGSVGWLSRPDVAGLTDWVINEKTAEMTEINRIHGTNADMWGWAQGPYDEANASADGRAFVAKYGPSAHGANVVNGYLESIEVEGFYEDPVAEVCRKDLAQWAASRAHDDGIVWDKYPITPEGLTHNYGHREFCGTGYKLCPGDVVWAFINGELIDRVQLILKSAQTGSIDNIPVKTPFRKARVPAFMKGDELPPTASLNGKTCTLVNREYKVTELTPCFTSASRSSTKSRSSLPEKTDVRIVYTFEAGGETWGLAAGGSRIPMKGLQEIEATDNAA